MGRGFVIRPGDARKVDMGSFEIKYHATGDRTDGRYTLLETSEGEPDIGPPLHTHADASEAFFVLDGRYVMFVDGEEFDCPAGSFIFIPKAVPHTFRSASIGSRKLNIFAPAAMEGYFIDLAEAMRRGVDDQGLADIAARYSMEVLGPSPEGYL